MIFSYKWIV